MGLSFTQGTRNYPQISPFLSVFLYSNLLGAESFLSFRYFMTQFNLCHRALIKLITCCSSWKLIVISNLSFKIPQVMSRARCSKVNLPSPLPRISAEAGSKAAAEAPSARGDGQWGRSAQSVVHKASLSGTPAFPTLPSFLGEGRGGGAALHSPISKSLPPSPEVPRDVWKNRQALRAVHLSKLRSGSQCPSRWQPGPSQRRQPRWALQKAAVPADPSLSPPASSDWNLVPWFLSCLAPRGPYPDPFHSLKS